MKNILILVLVIILSQVMSIANDDCLLRNDYKSAYIQYKQSLENNKNAENYLNMCIVTYYLKDADSSKNYCKSALNLIEKEDNPDLELKSNILSMLGLIYSTVYHNNEIMFEYLNEAKKIKEANDYADKYELAKLYRRLAFAYGYVENYILATKYLEKGIKLVEDLEEKHYKNLLAAFYYDYAKIREKNKNYKEELEFLEKSLNYANEADIYLNHSLNAAIYSKLANNYARTKSHKVDSENAFKKSIYENAMFPDNSLFENRKNLGKSYSKENLESLLKEYPYLPFLNLQLGSLYLTENDELANVFFEKTIKVNPKNVYAYLLIAREYSNKFKVTNDKKYQDLAKKYISVAFSKASCEPTIFYELGLISIDSNLSHFAKKCFHNYLKYTKDPNAETLVKKNFKKNL